MIRRVDFGGPCCGAAAHLPKPIAYFFQTDVAMGNVTVLMRVANTLTWSAPIVGLAITSWFRPSAGLQAGAGNCDRAGQGPPPCPSSARLAACLVRPALRGTSPGGGELADDFSVLALPLNTRRGARAALFQELVRPPRRPQVCCTVNVSVAGGPKALAVLSVRSPGRLSSSRHPCLVLPARRGLTICRPLPGCEQPEVW